MPVFRYIAKDAKGRTITGDMEAPEERVVAEALREHKLIILKIEAKKSEQVTNLLKILDKVHDTDVLNFTRQFAIMITSGLSITQSLSILQAQATRHSVQEVLDSILKDVQGGKSLAKAFEKFPAVFSPTYVALVRAGESAGLLEQIFPRLADTLEKQKEFKSKTKGALIYPAIVVIGMLAVMFIMMVFVIPKLSTLYQNVGTTLPLPTLILITVSNFMSKFWYLFIAMVIGGIIGFQVWKKTPRGLEILDAFFFKMPIFGPLRSTNILTEFTRTLGLLTSSGVPIIEALQIVSKTTGSVHYEREILTASVGVEKGLSLAQSLTNSSYFPKIVIFMVETGEQTGKLGDVLLKLSHFFEMEAEQKIKNLTVAMEPIIMIVLGVGVGFLILSIILPIYKLTSSFGG